jgi:endonuclease YncB( thermonuclease family)
LRNVYRFRRLKWGDPWRAATPAKKARPRRLDSLWVPVVAFVIVAAGGAVLMPDDVGRLPDELALASGAVVELLTPRRFSECTNGYAPTCVVDGDTFRLDGEIIRIADIDTPEVRDYQCASEKARGDRATRRLIALLNGGAFELERIDRDRDQYGRSLRIVVRAGRSVGGMLVDEGLARTWDGARRGWC